MIDNQNRDRSLLWLQLKPKLFRNCGKDRRPGSVRRVGVCCNILRCPGQLEIISAREAGVVENYAAQPLLRESACQSVHGDSTRSKLIHTWCCSIRGRCVTHSNEAGPCVAVFTTQSRRRQFGAVLCNYQCV